MTAAIIAEIKSLFAKLESAVTPAAETAETDVIAIGQSALGYIKTNGLTDLYKIAMSVLAGAATGTPWTTTLATVVTQGEAAGISIAKGAEAVVVAQAQADMIAAGTLLPPVAATPASAS
jgi:hypothetical protein